MSPCRTALSAGVQLACLCLSVVMISACSSSAAAEHRIGDSRNLVPTTARPDRAAAATATSDRVIGEPAQEAVVDRVDAADSSANVGTVARVTTTVAPTTTLPAQRLPPGLRNTVFVVGDSVMLGAERQVPEALEGWSVILDAKGSRRLPQALDLLEARRAEVGRVVVVMAGNNLIVGERGGYPAQIDQLLERFPDPEIVVWFTVAEVSSSRVALNDQIRQAATRHPRLVVADWASVAAANPRFTANDGLHLGPGGARALADLIVEALAERGVAPVSIGATTEG